MIWAGIPAFWDSHSQNPGDVGFPFSYYLAIWFRVRVRVTRHAHVTRGFGCYSDMVGHSHSQTPVICESPSHITLAIWFMVKVRVTGDAHITRVSAMGMSISL